MRPLDAVVRFFGGRRDAETKSQEISNNLFREQLEIERAIKDFTEVQRSIAEQKQKAGRGRR